MNTLDEYIKKYFLKINLFIFIFIFIIFILISLIHKLFKYFLLINFISLFIIKK